MPGNPLSGHTAANTTDTVDGLRDGGDELLKHLTAGGFRRFDAYTMLLLCKRESSLALRCHCN